MNKKVSVQKREPGIFELMMNDVENKNRLNKELRDEFITALDNLAEEKALKVLILSSTKDVFCAGATLEFLQEAAENKLADQGQYLYTLPNKLLNFPLPIVAALQGHAVGGGLILALCCDILVASEDSRYGVNFMDLGITPGMGTTTLLPALAGYHFASEMMLTAKLYRGSELRTRGLFNYIVPADEVWDRSLDIARRISEKPRHTLRMLKQTISLPRRQILQAALSCENLMHKICFKYPETASVIEENYLP